MQQNHAQMSAGGKQVDAGGKNNNKTTWSQTDKSAALDSYILGNMECTLPVQTPN
jgi:hypothetical protein